MISKTIVVKNDLSTKGYLQIQSNANQNTLIILLPPQKNGKRCPKIPLEPQNIPDNQNNLQ